MAGNFFSNIGNFFKKVFSPGAITVEATVADILLPGFAPLINSAATSIITAEGVAAAAGMQNGTGVQKMAYAVNLFESTYNTWAAANGLVQEPAAVQALLQQVFNLLQQLQTVAPSTPVVPSSSIVAGQTTSVQAQAKTGTLL